MTTPRRTTLRDIAERLGVHVTTVSLALRNSSRLPEETRLRVRRVADEMGYAPDPALTALSAYRSSVTPAAYHANLAWINCYPEREMVVSIPSFRDYLRGGAERAGELGYKLEEVWMHEPGMTIEGMQRRLRARGIRGMLILPQPVPGPIEGVAWEEFSAVTFGYSLTSPQLHRVTNHQFRSAMTLLRELRYLGYRRIGMYVTEEYDRRVNLSLSTAFRSYSDSIPEDERVPLLFQETPRSPDPLRAWIKRHAPQVIVCQNFYMWDYLEELGRKVPEDIGIAFFNLGREEEILSGIHQNDLAIGRAALDLLVGMLHRNERGVPASAQHVLIDGAWLPRTSTRRVGPPAPWFLDRRPEPVPYGPLKPPAAPAGSRRRAGPAS
jgi:LacI family transcriptional regulator